MDITTAAAELDKALARIKRKPTRRYRMALCPKCGHRFKVGLEADVDTRKPWCRDCFWKWFDDVNRKIGEMVRQNREEGRRS